MTPGKNLYERANEEGKEEGKEQGISTAILSGPANKAFQRARRHSPGLHDTKEDPAYDET